MKKAIDYFNGDELAATTWLNKYALQGEETPEDMHRRLAKEFARIELKYPNPMSEEEIFSLLDRFKYLVPQGSPMAGIGNDKTISSISNCFAIGGNSNSDSYGSIMRSDEEIAQIFKRRGGSGLDISHYRPSGIETNGAILDGSAGATLFMERFSHTTREVSQSGRRGALQISISVNHPDVDKFIAAKEDRTKITGANISVKITDEFMDAVNSNKDFIQSFPVDIDVALDREINVKDLTLNKLTKGALGWYKKINAKDLWEHLIRNAHKDAEPGVLFISAILNESPVDGYGPNWKTITTNPLAN